MAKHGFFELNQGENTTSNAEENNEMVVTPWEVKGKVDYERLIREFGTQPLTEELLAKLDGKTILDRVAALPITEWSFKAEPGVRHVGPMAQDFRASFAVGMDEKHITTVDAEGVALAAIQGLNQKVEALKSELVRRDAEKTDLQQRLGKLERLVQNLSRQGE